MVVSNISSPSLVEVAQTTRLAAQELAILASEARNQALTTIAQALAANKHQIIAANQLDCEIAEKEGISPALSARLKLSETKIQAAIAGIEDLVKLNDPLGNIQINRQLDEGLVLQRITCPLGVLGIIFEARPEALIQITSLAIKSGNGVILKGGKEATNSCQILTKIIRQALTKTQVSPETVQLLTTREEIKTLLGLDKYIDLIIPRGSNAFVRYVQENTKIPVLGHADGICHLYIDSRADLSQAINITVDSKTQYPAACNAIETLLIHQAIATEFLPLITQALKSKQVKLLGDEKARKIIDMEVATEVDWSTEYSDLVLSIKIVNSVEDAIAHINHYGSKHTEAIVTEESSTAQIFLDKVDAAGVFHNCSTRFADGFRYGFGAEVGISTQKMPPRGPVGLEGLVTYKYQLKGKGHIVATYTGENAKSFTHKDL
ncbi:MAG: glutamate-5-semialdehyde dehydrogenase [Cyanobacteria bacterium J083]|nr:MAG: glutamate-5-semialdehyde dehydrogenase [Cyanobacteria bacterium J083]